MNNDPLETLEGCHARIEAQLAALETLVRHMASHRTDGVAAGAARQVLDYFDTSAIEHHRDEDEELFPLLRRRAGALGRAEVAAAIDELEREHATMDRQWRRLRETLSAIAASEDVRFDREEIERFAWLYRRHMDRESLLVLPFAKEALPPPERAALAERIAVRRVAAQ